LIHGFFIIDKPAGITSHDVVSRVRRILGIRKVGHTGTLDPFATGVLPIAVNEATKVIPYLDEGVKCYQARLKVGLTTDTLDITGKVLSVSDFSSVDSELFSSVAQQYVGIIDQIPPMFSAIKKDGQPLYKLARQGQEVERQPRSVEIRSIEIVEFAPPYVLINVNCSRGTYVRTLADDIGREIGCGAVLQDLRRTVSGPFEIGNAISLGTLEELGQQGRIESAVLTPFLALSHLPNLQLTSAGFDKIGFGRSPEWSDTVCEEPLLCNHPQIARLSRGGELVGLAELVPEMGGETRIRLKRVFAAV
jgi:tRNA pseudouridine55 synthase